MSKDIQLFVVFPEDRLVEHAGDLHTVNDREKDVREREDLLRLVSLVLPMMRRKDRQSTAHLEDIRTR